MIIDRISTVWPITADHPYAQPFTLNDWVRLDHPGRYTLTVASRLVYRGQSFEDRGPTVTLQSMPLVLDIHPVSPAWRRRRLARAMNDFRRGNLARRFAAVRAAGYWDDPAAIPLLMGGLTQEETSGEAGIGLYALLDLAPLSVKTPVLSAFEDNARLISPHDIWPICVCSRRLIRGWKNSTRGSMKQHLNDGAMNTRHT